jgi:tetratricopeptide (TPR) repeat protein
MLATGMARVEQLGFRPVVQAQMLDALGRVNDQIGRFADAEQLLRRALALRREHLGANDLDVAVTLNNLADVLAQTNRTEEATRLSQEALAIQRRVLGPNHSDVALTLAMLARRTNDLAASESLLIASRDIQRRALGPSDPAVATADFELGSIMQARGKYERAQELYREGIAIRAKTAGSDRSPVALGMVRLAQLIELHFDKAAEAESLYQNALGILQAENPPRPARWGGALVGLEHLAHVRGDHVRAEGYARQLLDVHLRTIGLEHPITTEAMDGIAEHLAAQKRYAEADSVLTKAIEVVERSVGAVHPRPAWLLTSRARERVAAGRWKDAESDLRRSMAVLQQANATPTEFDGATIGLLAQVLEHEGQGAEAAQLYERSAAILRSNPPRAVLGVVAAYGALAEHFRKVGRPEDEAYFSKLAR